MKHNIFVAAMAMIALTACTANEEQVPVMETGGPNMPAEGMPNQWIDKDTGHKIKKLTLREGSNQSFYFHNNPFLTTNNGKTEMVFHGGEQAHKTTDMVHGGDAATNHYQMYAVDLEVLNGKELPNNGIRQITNQPNSVRSEIVCTATKELFFQRNDSVFAASTDNGDVRYIASIPEGRTGHIVCINADGTKLAGTYENPQEAVIYTEHPKKSEFFNLIYDAHLEKTIFSLDTKTGVFEDVYTENAWLNHLQFSPADPNLLMFCHEGPWHKVTRVWLVDIVKKDAPRAMHQRTMDMEIWGHEWFGAQGEYLYFDLQKPKGETFWIGKVNIKTGEEEDFEMKRCEWSVHFVTSWDETFLLGDGGSSTKSVAHDPDGQWIYKFNYPEAADADGVKRFNTERLVNMKHHDYNLEPNVHLSPDGKWCIFRANFEGVDNVYAVEL